MATPLDNNALAEQAVKLGYVQSPQEYLAAEARGKQQAGIKTVDASKVGTTEPLDIPTTKNTSKTDRAMAGIVTTPQTEEEPKKFTFSDLVSQSMSGIKDPEQKNMVQQLLNAVDQTTGGQYTQAGEDVLSRLLDTQINQSKRKKEQARLQEQAGLPELFAEQALIESNYDNSEAARNSRLLNEAGGKTTISKSALQNRQSEIQRQYGLQVADNRINELVVAGKINSANILIDKKLDLKYGDLEAEIDLYKSQLEAIAPFMNNEQQKLAEQRQFLLTQATNEINSAREEQKQLELTKATALKNAVDRGASPLQIAQIQDAQSLGDIASTGFTTTLQERLQSQLLGQQITTEGLQQQQIKANTAKALQEVATNQPQQGATQAQIETINNINNIIDDPSFSSTFGLTGIAFRNIPSAPQYTLKNKVQEVINDLALAARGQLKGQGTVSDFEGKMLKEAQTSLTLNTNPNDAKKELTKIKGAIITSSGGSASVRITSPDGESKDGVANQQMINDAINSGYRVEYI